MSKEGDGVYQTKKDEWIDLLDQIEKHIRFDNGLVARALIKTLRRSIKDADIQSYNK